MRSKWKGALIGGIGGALVWLYDYDFLMNPGGPTTPISDLIRGLLGATSNISNPLILLLPLFFLIFFGVVLGVTISHFVNKIKNEK